eukprot:Gb_12602 [translate_table: standard]
MEEGQEPPTRILIAVNQSSVTGYPHPSISCSNAFEWTLKKLIRRRCNQDFKLHFLHVQVPDEDGGVELVTSSCQMLCSNRMIWATMHCSVIASSNSVSHDLAYCSFLVEAQFSFSSYHEVTRWAFSLAANCSLESFTVYRSPLQKELVCIEDGKEPNFISFLLLGYPLWWAYNVVLVLNAMQPFLRGCRTMGRTLLMSSLIPIIGDCLLYAQCIAMYTPPSPFLVCGMCLRPISPLGLNMGFSDMDSIFASPDDFRDMKNRDKIRGIHLLEYFVKRCNELGVPCEGWIKKGDPKEVICHEVKEVHPDILVVGSRGLGPFQSLGLFQR